MRARRLVVLLTLSLSTLAAACGSLPTSNDDPSAPPPADSSKRDNFPWN